MTLQGAALTPASGVVVTVTGEFAELDGGARMGGDHIVVCNPNNTDVPCERDSVAGPNSPLVVYGDTSQDGVWYSGRVADIKGYEFGPKPFDPFPALPDGDNEDDEWVFPLANPYDAHRAGNDVIDASNLFAHLTCTATDCDLPTIGFTAYGGAGNDTIIGSQAGDHLAGGSGDDTILGLRGVDHIYGDSGANVNILDRALVITTTNASPRPTITGVGFQNNGTTIEPYPAEVADLLDPGRDTLAGSGIGTLLGGPDEVYWDIVFGDHGFVLQDVIDPNLPDPRLQKIQTTAPESLIAFCSARPQDGADDTLVGSDRQDVLIGGGGNDMIDGLEGDDLLFGDNACLYRTDFTSERFQALAGLDPLQPLRPRAVPDCRRQRTAAHRRPGALVPGTGRGAVVGRVRLRLPRPAHLRHRGRHRRRRLVRQRLHRRRPRPRHDLRAARQRCHPG